MLFKLEDVRYALEGQDILKPVNLEIERGQHLLLLGKSGCGKTTLMNIMATLLRPSAGYITFNDTPYASLSQKETDKLRAHNFGFIFQNMHLIGHLSVYDNIALAQSTADVHRIRTLINELGLEGKENQKAHNLSGGEAQRTAIARALANAPSVVFADEPTSALDDENTEKVIKLLLDQAQKNNATLIIATHDARTKPYFKNILEMSE